MIWGTLEGTRSAWKTRDPLGITDAQRHFRGYMGRGEQRETLDSVGAVQEATGYRDQ